MGVWGRLLHKENNMNYLDVNENKRLEIKALIMANKYLKKKKPKPPKIGKKASKNRKKKERKEREYKRRIPKKYKIYIKSGFWKNRKNNFWQTYGRKCVICKTSKRVDLHHMLYENYGFEKDEDLMALCREHHLAFHSNYPLQKDMRKDTIEFMQEETIKLQRS